MMKRILKVFIAMILMLCMLAPMAIAEEAPYMKQDPDWYPYEADQPPLYVVNCNEWISVWSDSEGSERKGRLKLGTCIYYWAPYNEDFIYFDLVGDGGFVKWDYLSYEKGGKPVKAGGSGSTDNSDMSATDRPLYVVNCNEWITLWSEPCVGSGRQAVLSKGMRLEGWEPYNEDFVMYNTGHVTGYVSWKHLSFDAP